MRNLIGLWIGKIIVFFLKHSKRGSVFPGKIAYKLSPNILTIFKMPKKVIAVTGSSGKGSVSSTIAYVYQNMGYTVAHNYKGSNLRVGIITLLLEHASITGKVKKDVLICEVDERYTKYVFPYLKPNDVIITNICRDQPPRQGHFDLVFDEIKKALTPNMHLILNGDDPYLKRFVLKGQQVTYYGLNKQNHSYLEQKYGSPNLVYCPNCNQKLKYQFYHFETLGDFSCPNCNFKRESIAYLADKLDHSIIINDTYTIHTNCDILFTLYNTLATFAVCAKNNLDLKTVSDLLSNIPQNKKIYEQFSFHNREIYVLNNKNENSTTFNQSLDFLTQKKELKTIVIGWKEISRRYQFDDLSWLYDIDFELLKNNQIDQIICVGIHAYDIATRLKYADIQEKKIKTFETLEEATSYIKQKTKGNLYAILNFDYVEPFKNQMKGSNI